MTHIVYRQLPHLPHRQYMRRLVHGTLVLWHRDPAIALRMERDRALAWAATLQARSTGYDNTQGATEPLGEYGTLEVTP